jgi:hypothetical protein
MYLLAVVDRFAILKTKSVLSSGRQGGNNTRPFAGTVRLEQVHPIANTECWVL